MAYTIGIDYGTNSVRAVVVSCANGTVVGTSVFDYPSGEQGGPLHPRSRISRARIRPTTSPAFARR